jgi:EVE domain
MLAPGLGQKYQVATIEGRRNPGSAARLASDFVSLNPGYNQTMTTCWIAVASAEHVRRGLKENFMQVGHGKLAPLARIKPGDRIVYYSPTVTLGGKDKLQAFTAIGTVKEGEPYRFDMGKGFKPYRRDVAWAKANEAPIRPLLDTLEFTAGKPNWGYQLRFGLFPISDADFHLIAAAMGAAL